MKYCTLVSKTPKPGEVVDVMVEDHDDDEDDDDADDYRNARRAR